MKLKNMTLGRRIALTLGALGAVVAIAGVLLVQGTGSVRTNLQDISAQHRTQELAAEAELLLSSSHVDALVMVLGLDDEEVVEERIAETTARLEEISGLLDESVSAPAARAALDEFLGYRAQIAAASEEAAATAGDEGGVAISPESVELATASVAALDSLTAAVEERTLAMEASAEDNYGRVRTMGFAAGVIVLLLGGLAGWRLTRTVSSSVGRNAEAVDRSSAELGAVSSQLGSNAEETAAQAGVVSAAAEEVSSNVSTVATAVEELGASITEIASNATEAANVASRAVTAAESTNATVSKLGDSSAEIGQVIDVITSIAEQTNLLALNATIEAARAGEAGKGFAVVANEVKELAKQTSAATEEIGVKIAAIQTDSSGAVDAIGEISEIIDRVATLQSTIASAVEEQTATTNEISRSVTEAARGSSEIAENITSVATAARSTAAGAESTQAAAADLARVAAELQALVSAANGIDHDDVRPAPEAPEATGPATPRAGSAAGDRWAEVSGFDPVGAVGN